MERHSLSRCTKAKDECFSTMYNLPHGELVLIGLGGS